LGVVMKTLYLELDEEITSVIDKLTQIEDDEVILVAPIGAQLLSSLVNFKLLKREADNLGKNIVIVTADELGRQLAVRANLTAKKNIEETGFDNGPEIFPNIVLSGVKTLPKEEPEEKDILDALVEELDLDIREVSFKEPKTELAAKKMVDIIGPAKRRSGFSPRLFLKSKEFGAGKLLKKIIRSPLKTGTETISKEPTIDLGPVQERARPLLKRPYLLFVFIGLSLLMAGLVVYLILPRAEILISPKTETVSFELSVKGSKNISKIDPVLNKIPVQLIRIEKTVERDFKATGEKQLNEKARGIITVYNEYSSSPQTLVATTRFLAENGKLFRINKTVVVPGAKVEEGKIAASAIDIEVEADQPGEEYNIGPAKFTIPGLQGTVKYAGFYGRSKAPMTNGSKELVKVVSAKDLEKAEELLTEEAKTSIQQALQEQMPSDLKLIEGALLEKITEKSSSPGLEAKAERFVFKVNIVGQALLFNEAHLKDLVNLNLAAEISQDKIPLSQTQQIVWDKPIIDWDKTEVNLNLDIQEQTAWQINIDDLIENLAGKSEIEVRKYLANQPEIKEAKVAFRPFWVKRVPKEKSKIKITVE